MNLNLNSDNKLRVVLIHDLPEILLDYANLTYKFKHSVEMNLNTAHLVFNRMRLAGTLNLDNFDLLHDEPVTNFYMLSKSIKSTKNHIWNPEQADTHCHLWSSGNIKNYEITEDKEKAMICTMCSTSLSRLEKKKKNIMAHI